MPSDDTFVSMVRFWLFSKALKVTLWLAPAGDSKSLLKTKIGEWALENETQWRMRHPKRASE